MNKLALYLSCFAFLFIPRLCVAHDANIPSGVAKIFPDGRVHLNVNFDVLAYALNDSPDRVPNEAMDALLDGPIETLKQRLVEAQQRFANSFQILADGKPVALDQVSFPNESDMVRWKLSRAHPGLPVMLELSVDARLPPPTRSVAFKFPEVMGQVVFTVDRPNAEARSFALEEGVASPPVPITLESAGTATAPTTATAAPAPLAPAEPGKLATIWRFIVLGFEHILPRGLDHILFVLGLFLLSTRIGPLLSQVTAFTIAHSVTLALSLYGIVRLPPAVVEPLIAASIAFVAIENIFTSELKPWRPLVVFGFGLVHGLGFAGVLTEAGLPHRELVTALISFNLGIELGQLTVITIAFLLVGWFRKRIWYRKVIVIPASAMIALMGIFWMIQRIFFFRA